MNTQAENITIAEAMRLFGFGRTKLYALIKNGDIEALKLGRRTLIRAGSARDYMSKLPRFGGQI